MSVSGSPQWPNWHKEFGIRWTNCRPELKGKLVTAGTWNLAIVDELAAPQPGDIVIVKTRYRELQERGVRYLFLYQHLRPMCAWNPRDATHFSWTTGPS